MNQSILLRSKYKENSDIPIEGTWSWDRVQSPEIYIILRKSKTGFHFSILKNNDTAILRNKKLIQEQDKYWHFCNIWGNSIGAQFYYLDTHNPINYKQHIFINVQEFIPINSSFIKHILLGYQYNTINKKWENFEKEYRLSKL